MASSLGRLWMGKFGFQQHKISQRGVSQINNQFEYSQNARERSKTVASYYNQGAIDLAAAKRSAQYLQKELPVRIAHRIVGFRNLPFIVGCNPTILAVHENYIRSFHILSELSMITNFEMEQKFSQLLRELLESHKHVVTQLAEGFKDSRRHLKPNHVGIISVSMKLKDVIEKWTDFVRATIESHLDSPESALPPVTITIANNDVDFIIRISDRGGGIPHQLMNLVMDYHFTTAGSSTDHRIDGGLFGTIMDCNNDGPAGPMHGFGFGLPTSRAYADYLGGQVTVESMQGIGTDVYLRLRQIDGKYESFRI
uniref:Protein-serine/threonine kinase n=1 Tax=Strigamia maritima TaxID=126957 RepID=T1IX65_STRMM